jgi:hypothetical protein
MSIRHANSVLKNTLGIVFIILSIFTQAPISSAVPGSSSSDQTLTPLCASNETAFVSLDGTSGSYGFFACYVKPISYQLKIIKASLIKADGSTVDIYNPASATYQDIVAGEVNLLEGLDLTSGTYDGEYKGLILIFDNDIRVKARASYSGEGIPAWSGRVGSTAYCHTLAYGPGSDPDHLTSFAGTANGNPGKFGDHPTFKDSKEASFESPGLSTFRYLGSPMTGAGIVGKQKVTNGAYWTSVTYDTTGASSTADFDILDANFQKTADPEVYNSSTNRSDRNARYGRYQFNFKSNFSITSSTKQLIEIKFDLTKAIGFAWNYSSNGQRVDNAKSDSGTYYYSMGRQAQDFESWNGTDYSNGYPDCLRMFIGKIDLSVSSTIITPSSVTATGSSDG